MRENKFLQVLCSLPIILIVLYFIPFLGVCLILFRYYVYRARKYYSTPIMLVVLGLILTIPKLIDSILKAFNSKINIPYLDTIINSDTYLKLLNYSKLLITVGIIFIMLCFIFKSLYVRLSSKVKNFVDEQQKKDYEISQKNNLIIKERQERAKNTHVVYCPHCGADNMLFEKTGVCKFCRRQIEYKEK